MFGKYVLKRRDIVVATVGPWPTHPKSVVGKVTIIPEHVEGSLLNQNTVRIRAKELCTQEYLKYSLLCDDFRNYIVGTARGSASQASKRIEDIENYEIFLPDLEEQQKITDVLSALDEKIYNNEMQNIRLIEIRNSLLPRLMTGKMKTS